MKNKKVLILLGIIFLIILVILILILNKPNKEEKEIEKNFEKLDNQVIDVTYNKTFNDLSSNTLNLEDDFTVSISDYNCSEDDNLKLKLIIDFSKGNTELADVMYDTILYNKEYFFYGQQYKEFNKLKDFTQDYPQGVGMGITRINGGENMTSKVIQDMIVFSFNDEFSTNNLSFSLYNISYQPEGPLNRYYIDDQRVTFNINIED